MEFYPRGEGGEGAGEAKLKGYVKHPAVYERYPALSETRLFLMPEGDPYLGVSVPEENTLLVNEGMGGDPEGVLLHEMQHLIQSLDGTPQGSSEGYWTGERARRQMRIWCLRRRMEGMDGYFPNESTMLNKTPMQKIKRNILIKITQWITRKLLGISL